MWSEPGLLAYAPIDVSNDSATPLWSEGPTAILISATLEHGFVERLGTEHADRFDAESAYDFRTQALLYVPRRVAEPRDEAVAAQVEEPADGPAGERCPHDVVPDARDDRLTASRTARTRCSSRARRRVSACSGASARKPIRSRRDRDFWQGVDVAGESLSLLVMDKLPFASPGDPLTEARCERIVEHGGDWFDDYALPIATLQPRQGFGRLFAATPTAASPQSSTEAVHAGAWPAPARRAAVVPAGGRPRRRRALLQNDAAVAV